MKCIICSNEIEMTKKRGRPRNICLSCEQYKPKSALSGKYYQWWKFLLTLNGEELHVLFKKRKEDCKYTQNKQEIIKLRTEMVIINEVYENLLRQIENNDI